MSEARLIARFAYRHEAEFAANILDGVGIRSFLKIDDAGGLYAGLTFTNPARLLVRTDDGPRALEVLADAGLLPGQEDEENGENGQGE
jgi:hypothetical protein